MKYLDKRTTILTADENPDDCFAFEDDLEERGVIAEIYVDSSSRYGGKQAMRGLKSNVTILLADDDPDDFFLVRDALQENGIFNDIRLVADGEELMDYLLNRNKYMNLREFPRPGLILLDLNMPKKDGREALAEIRTHQYLRRIPVIVYTTSQDSEDVTYCYEQGANSYIRKPASFESLSDIIVTTIRYWLGVVELPSSESRVNGHN